MERYNFTDLMKFLLALLLVVAHCASEIVQFPVVIDLCFSFYIVVVPFFLCVSSFFLFKKIYRAVNYREQVALYRAYSFRVLGLYAVWSGIYMFLLLLSWWKSGATPEEVIHYFHEALVYSTYPTIWFLPALWVAVSCVFVLHIKYKCCISQVLVLSVILYLVGAAGYSYSDLMPFPLKRLSEWYEFVFITWRNGLFNGFVFCVLGACLATPAFKRFSRADSLLCLLFGAGFTCEAFLMKSISLASDANFLILMIPFTYFFVRVTNRVVLNNSPVYRIVRHLSSLVFLSQRLFITAIPALLPGSVMVGLMVNPYIGTGIVLGCTLLFSVLLWWASGKWNILKFMY